MTKSYEKSQAANPFRRVPAHSGDIRIDVDSAAFRSFDRWMSHPLTEFVDRMKCAHKLAPPVANARAIKT